MKDTEYSENKNSPKQEEKLQELFETAVKQLDDAQVVEPYRRESREDRRFVSVSGAQWDGDWAMNFKDTPKMVFNKVLLAVTRIMNEYRNNRITVRFKPDPEGTQEGAEMLQDLFRADEEDSSAQEAYDNAFSEGVKGGYGGLRLCIAEEDDEDPANDRRRIQFEPIYDADYAIWWDPNAKKYDKSDAQWCHLVKSMTHEAFEAEFPDADKVSVQVLQNLSERYEWFRPTEVSVSEYYKLEKVPEKLYGYELLTGQQKWFSDEDFELNEGLEERLIATGAKELGEKTVNKKKARKVIMSGAALLKDCGHVCRKRIPVIPFFGQRDVIDGIEHCYGPVRFAKDPQRLGNMQRSKLAEISALESAATPILYAEEIANHEESWRERNIGRPSHLVRNVLRDQDGTPIITPMQYTKTAELPQALAALIEITNQDLSDILGNQEKGDKIVSNISGRAVGKVQERLDYLSFIYMSNFAKTLRAVGEVWFLMKQDISVEKGQKVKALKEDGKEYTVTLNQEKLSESGFGIEENDLRSKKFSVSFGIGPSSKSARETAFENSTALLGVISDPETKAVLELHAVMNMEGENTENLRAFARQKLLRMGAIKPTPEEQTEIDKERQAPDPQAEFLKAEAMKSEAQARKADADTQHTVQKTQETMAKTRETKAETLKILDEIGKSELPNQQ